MIPVNECYKSYHTNLQKCSTTRWGTYHTGNNYYCYVIWKNPVSSKTNCQIRFNKSQVKMSETMQ